MAKKRKQEKKKTTTQQGALFKSKEKVSADKGKVLLSWRAQPYAEEKMKTVILIVSTLLFGRLVWYAFDIYAGILAVMVSLGAFSSFLLPSSYVLYENGLEVKANVNNPVFRRWIAFTSYHIFPDGVQMMFGKRRVRDRLMKGILVYFGDADADLVKQIIIEKMAPIVELDSE